MVRSTVCCNKFKHENLLFRLLTVMSLSIVSRKALALSLSPPLFSQYNGRIALMIAALNGKSRIVDILIKADPSGDHLNMKVG